METEQKYKDFIIFRKAKESGRINQDGFFALWFYPKENKEAIEILREEAKQC